ncbi:FAD/NAD(P)-binding protein [Achromobacter sp. Marseille-Q0513]|uniref:FAD/NAD(P)-binding protein n=1 Tax=Achromobacter sp. Marseille-Q0513 TaxID=2829161 RepID=UPI001BA049BE|nr:FAD/NAD(P)-binding protein [Achromobacter sp. Marseille-Q0513]MBR8652832.1 FAD/NAD(P)-binding protein [Achromobacter sp. Marseille-Q0513]
MTAAPDTRDAQAVDLAIIGGGSVGVSLLLQFLLSLPAGGGRPLSLRLYEPQEHPGPGGAYQDDLRSNLLNIPAGNMSALADERLDFVDWLRRQDPAWLAGHGVEGAIDPGDFLPRPLFGAYMAHAYERARALAPGRGVTLEHVRARVGGITPLADGRVRVLAESGQPCVARRVALCNGNLPSRAFPALEAAPGYFNSPYPVSELAAGIASDATVCVIGTSLSAVDAVAALQQAEHRGPLVCVSRNGRLPSVRSPHNRPPPQGLAELSRDGALKLANAHGGALTLERIAAALDREVRALGGTIDTEDILGGDGDARTALDDEIRRSEHGARPWQAVAAATNAAVDLIWHLLPDAERARFQSQWRALWMARRANFPMRNARKLQALFRAGQLEVLSGYVDSRHDAAGGFVTRLRTPAGERELRSRYLINATSFSVDAAGAADPLVSALLRDGHGQAHPHGGLALDYATGSLLDACGAAQAAITVLGSLAGGTYFWTTSMDVNARLARDQARRIAAALADAGATDPGSRRDTPCPGISPAHRPPRPAPAASSGPR